jgi:hypothetical protein
VIERIALLVPTRGRPYQLADMWRSALKTADRPDLLQLVLGLDLDDPADTVGWAHQQMGQALAESRDPQVSYVMGERRVLSVYWNECAAHTDAGIMWHGNDDVIFRNASWDTYVRAGFDQWPDRIGCVHGRDGIHDGNMATLGWYSRPWVDALGYFCPPIFKSDYNDAWLSGCANAIGRRHYDERIFTEHMHPAVNKAVMDQTHRDRLAHQAEADQRWRDTPAEREADVAKLQAAIVAARDRP